MTRLTGGEVIAQSLAHRGIDTVFGLPGIQLDNFFDGLHGVSNRIRTIHTRHEQGAGYMAMGYAQASGKPGTFVVVPGPGVLNATAALCTADGSNVPVLCITGQIPLPQIGKGFGIAHELRDQEAALGGIVDWVGRADRVEDSIPMLDQAFKQMLAVRPRPVVYEMPPDIMATYAEVEITGDVPSPDALPLDPKQIGAAAALLADAKRPAILVGSGAIGAEAQILALAEILQAPVIMTRTGRGIVSDRHYLAQTMIAGQQIWTDVDVALIVGTRFLAAGMSWGRDKEVKTIRVDVDPVRASKPRAADVTVIGRAAASVAAITNRLGELTPRPSREAELAAVKASVNAQLEQMQPQQGYARVIREVLPEDGIIVTDVTQMGTYIQNATPFYKPRTLITPGYQATLGYAYATALGAQIAKPDQKVLAVCGDGGFMFTVQEIATAVAHKIPVVAIIFNDGAFGNVRRIQKDAFGGRMIASDLHNPDFVRLAEAFGALGLRAEGADQLRDALKQAFAANRPTIIDVPVGEMPNVWSLIKRPRSQGTAAS
jgi:acetolactate synthase-1/2/3 large subunit